MMKLPPLSSGPLEPVNLRREAELLHRTIRDLELDDANGDFDGTDYGDAFRAAVEAVRKGAPLPTEHRRRIRAIVAWAGHGIASGARGAPPLEDLLALVDAAFPDRRLPERTWWTLASRVWAPSTIPAIEDRRPSTLSEGFLRTRPGLRADLPAASLPDALAAAAAAERRPLTDALRLCRLTRDSALGEATLANLFGPTHRAWLRSRDRSEILAFLDETAGSVWVGRIGAGLLAPAVNGALPVATIVRDERWHTWLQALSRAMPKDRHHPAWSELGDGAARVLKAWQNLHDLEEFFKAWNVEAERRDFWRRYAAVIDEIVGFPKAKALAMRMGDVWFVEVGVTGYATYALRDQPDRSAVGHRAKAGWLTHARRLAKISTSEALRDHCRAYLIEESPRHVGAWQRRFEEYIERLSGHRP